MDKPIPAGSSIGFLGAGQLAGMLIPAAQSLGYEVRTYSTREDDPAHRMTKRSFFGEFNEWRRLGAFAKGLSIVTAEFETVPSWTLGFFEQRGILVRPSPSAFAIAQDRLEEKKFARSLDIPTAEFCEISRKKDLPNTVRIGLPGRLKTRREGYDGKGQYRVKTPEDLSAAWILLKEQPCIYEQEVPFTKEISVIIARGADGQMELFPVFENRHERGVLVETHCPARIGIRTLMSANVAAQRLAQQLEYVGVLAVEFFVLAVEGVVFIEMAPRVHNSGHLTIEACVTSQFEQHIRAICGLPLGAPDLLCSSAKMWNLFGDEIYGMLEHLRNPNRAVHIYGKKELRNGRKCGHVTELFPKKF